MPIPITVPGTALPVTDGNVTRAEELLTAILQAMCSGTTGSTVTTPPILVQTAPDQPLSPLVMDTAEKQLALRQLAHAIASWSSGPVGQYRAVANNAARDAISSSDRVEGMLVRTNDSGIFWLLGSDLTTWSHLSSFP